jgi:hypothetical protein
MWVTLRSSSRRRFGLLWLIALTLPLLSVSLVLEPRLEADAYGALLPSACAVIAFATCGAGLLLGWLAALWPRFEQALTSVLLLLSVLGLVLHPVPPSAAAAELSDSLDDLTRRELAPRAVLFSDDASATFRHQGREAEEQLRPDITLVPLAFRNMPHVVDEWAKAQPELSESLRDLVLSGQLSAGTLQSLSALRPVYVELSDQVPAALFGTALDEGLLARVLPDGVTQGDLRSERAAQAVRLGTLYRGRRSWLDADGDGAFLLGRAHFYQALLRVRLADPEGAHDYCELSLANGFADPRPERLLQELGEKKKIDIEGYLKPAQVEQLGQ